MDERDGRPVIGIIMGDPAGIGPEVALKSALDAGVREACRPLLVGNQAVLQQNVARLGLTLRLAAVTEDGVSGFSWDDPAVAPVVESAGSASEIPVGKVSAVSGAAAAGAIRTAFALAEQGRVDALVMAPLTKESLALAEGFSSEFEMFEALTGTQEVRAAIAWRNLVRITVTEHLAFRKIIERLTPERIVTTAEQLLDVLRRLGTAEPRMAVAALNPHGGEGGLFGDEEKTVIAPAIGTLAGRGLTLHGPIPADTVWVRAMRGEFDGVVFLYHDQGNIAMKAVAFGEGVLIYTGLPFVVVSVGHGSALDIAGRGVANPGNMIAALVAAAKLAGR